MTVSNSIAAWQARRSAVAGRTIGLVPTMGALHEGHASLVRRCREENEIAVVTIFINPTQFNDPADLDKYPRTMESDLAMLRGLGVDEVLAPAVQDLYPNGYRFRVQAPDLTGAMEGACRPGFLEGVMTIVLKLLNLVRPDRAYFGEKDYQQLQVICAMVADLFIATEIVPCPTVREPSGLAMSSRNVRLSPAARAIAPLLSRALSTVNCAEDARTMLADHGFAVEYVEEHWGRRLAAVFLDGVRLIDNVPLNGGSH